MVSLKIFTAIKSIENYFPFSGNKVHLQDFPEEHRIDITKFLREYRETYYSSQFMTLAIQAPLEVDEIEFLARNFFETVENKFSNSKD